MAVNLSPVGGVAAQFFDNNGDPLSGGLLYSYASGTTTPLATYTSSTGVTPNTNPIVLDSAGRVPGAEVWLSEAVNYKFTLKTSTDVLIGTWDMVGGIILAPIGSLYLTGSLTAATADILGVATLNSLVVATTAAVANLTASGEVSVSGEVSAPVVRATTKFVFSDDTEQTTASGNAFSSGTAMLFVQTSAPTGWVKSTTHDNKALRVVSGTAGAGGSVAFTTAFANQAVSGTNGAIGATTLTIAQIPSHTHTRGMWDASSGFTNRPVNTFDTSENPELSTGATGGGGSHTHTASTFTGTAINLAVQYVDVIICAKS